MPVNKTGVKKNGLQQYRVRVNYTDAAGKARQIERTAYGLAEANALEQSLIAEYKDKKQTVSRMTVQQLYDEYEVYHRHETRKTSHDSAMKNLRLRVMPTMAGILPAVQRGLPRVRRRSSPPGHLHREPQQGVRESRRTSSYSHS